MELCHWQRLRRRVSNVLCLKDCAPTSRRAQMRDEERTRVDAIELQLGVDILLLDSSVGRHVDGGHGCVSVGCVQ